MLCTKCGRELKDTDAFCAVCGTPRPMPVNPPVYMSAPTEKKANKKKEMY